MLFILLLIQEVIDNIIKGVYSAKTNSYKAWIIHFGNPKEEAYLAGGDSKDDILKLLGPFKTVQIKRAKGADWYFENQLTPKIDWSSRNKAIYYYKVG